MKWFPVAFSTLFNLEENSCRIYLKISVYSVIYPITFREEEMFHPFPFANIVLLTEKTWLEFELATPIKFYVQITVTLRTHLITVYGFYWHS